MAISVTYNSAGKNDVRFVSGTFTLAAGDVSGNITTGLSFILGGDALSSGQSYPNDLTRPNVRYNHDGSSTSNGTLRIEAAADGDDGTWWAFGYGG